MPESVEQPIQQPQVTVTTKSTNWKKVLLTIVFIVGVVAVISGIYWFLVVNKNLDNSDLTGPVPKVTTKTSTESAKDSTPSAKKEKNETNSWKLYTGEAVLDGKVYPFQFKYPQNFVLKSENKPFRKIVVDSSGGNLSVYYSGDVEIATDWKCAEGEGKFSFAGYITQKAICTSPNSPGVTYISLGGPRAANWPSEYQTVPVTVTIFYKDAQTGKLFEQILSTFKFLD